MNVVEKALSSARFNRLMLLFGALVLAAGALALVLKFAGGSDRTSSAPDKGFKPALPAKQIPLKNSSGVAVKTFWQLDPKVRTTIKTFISTAVVRKHLDQSWAVIAPEMKRGYTFDSWRTATALPVVPYKEILIEVGVSAPEKYHVRPTTFQLGLIPVGKVGSQRWLVNYWMPRWTPPLPEN